MLATSIHRLRRIRHPLQMKSECQETYRGAHLRQSARGRSVTADSSSVRNLRPRIALTIAAAALLVAIVLGIMHVVMLGRSGDAIEVSRQTIRTLHGYNAALEVWRQMAAAGVQFPGQERLRDSIAQALRSDLQGLQARFDDPTDRQLVVEVLEDFDASTTAPAGSELGLRGREAMIVLTARQVSALFHAAARNRRSQLFAAIAIGLAVVAAGSFVAPMWANTSRDVA
jgi:hypothetical protein